MRAVAAHGVFAALALGALLLDAAGCSHLQWRRSGSCRPRPLKALGRILDAATGAARVAPR